MYSATLSNYKKFMDSRNTYQIPPVLPFLGFKWRWAVATPSESINTKEVLLGVLSILHKHNGNKHATQQFQDDLLALQNSIDASIDLAKVNRGLNKNIIENSGQYWKALGLLKNSSGGEINLTDLGVKLAENKISNFEFIEYLYNNFSLPNTNIESSSTILVWRDNDVIVKPIYLIINILNNLRYNYNSPIEWYISPEELRDIVVPLSVYKDIPVSMFVEQIITYRANPSGFSSWPNCVPSDNDFRMLKEYLLFLSNFSFLDFIELKDKSKRFYINENSINIVADEEYHVNRNDSQSDSTEQVIFFGAPGTGKSYKVNNIVQNKDDKTHRVTFHPEYDYASFIGGYKPTMEEDDSKEVIKYKFVPQAFTNIYVKAWNDPNNTYYLVIEEINRGNCAEIFGDIFQLLDRDSDYSITPSIELKDYLKTSLVNKDKGLKNGKLKLPRNLNIYATMNTSDQSLFPMDSAFKRRWNWEYIPICYEELTEEGKPNPSFNYVVDLDSHNSFKWNEFISKVNLNHIQDNPVLGMDKCIGNYFVIPKNGGKAIDVATFINKAIFYLWNDVFKDEKNEVFEENSSYEDFFPIKSKGVQKLKELLERIEVNINTKSEDTAPEEDEVTS